MGHSVISNMVSKPGDLLWVRSQRLYMIGPLLLSKEKCSLSFLDLAKAFDSVFHYHLQLRLDLLGVCGDLLNWF